jgi:predicted nucleotidyltransferase
MAQAPEFPVTRLLRRLVEGGVDFLVIGGVAVVVHALPRYTKDLDILYATTPENLERLGTVLTSLHARRRGVEEDTPFVADARTLRRTQVLCLVTDEGELDLLVRPDGAADYGTMRRRAVEINIDGLIVPVASIDDLIAMKDAAGRPQDLIDIEALETARRLRQVDPR